MDSAHSHHSDCTAQSLYHLTTPSSLAHSRHCHFITTALFIAHYSITINGDTTRFPLSSAQSLHLLTATAISPLSLHHHSTIHRPLQYYN